VTQIIKTTRDVINKIEERFRCLADVDEPECTIDIDHAKANDYLPELEALLQCSLTGDVVRLVTD